MTSKRIAEALRARIVSGDLPAGAKVPSVRQLMRRWGVANATASKALAELRSQGLVRSVPGKGTVVDQGLGAARIIALSVEIADREGLAALSMRRVAAELGVSTMSLYRHVASKEELVLQMANGIFAQTRWPRTPPDGWRPRLEVLARLEWEHYRSHPWLAAAISFSRPQTIPSGMAHTEWALQALEGLRLSAAELLSAALTIIGYVRGAAVSLEAEAQAEQETGLSAAQHLAAQQAQFEQLFAGGAYPALERVSREPSLDASPDRLFEFGLARLLDGLEVLLKSRLR
jgi:AcrR family transcriptional regulator